MSGNIIKVKVLLNIEVDKYDTFFEFCEKIIANGICDRCHITEIPKRLDSLIQEFLVEQYTLNREGIGKGIQEVSSVSDNGQTVSFNTNGGTNAMSKNANEFLNKNMSILVAYRRTSR